MESLGLWLTIWFVASISLIVSISSPPKSSSNARHFAWPFALLSDAVPPVLGCQFTRARWLVVYTAGHLARWDRSQRMPPKSGPSPRPPVGAACLSFRSCPIRWICILKQFKLDIRHLVLRSDWMLIFFPLGSSWNCPLDLDSNLLSPPVALDFSLVSVVRPYGQPWAAWPCPRPSWISPACVVLVVGVIERREWKFEGRNLEIFSLFCGSRSFGGKRNWSLIAC